jgi:hypothetical protein
VATVTWLYAAAFGIPAIPVAMFLQREGRLPSLWGLFEIYAGPWTTASDPDHVRLLVLTYFGV